MIGARNNVMGLGRRRETTSQRARTRRTRWVGRTCRTRSVRWRARWFLVRPHGFLPGADCSLWRMLCRRSNSVALVIGIELLRGKTWISDLCQRTTPVRTGSQRRRGRSWRRLLRLRCAPLRSSGSMQAGWLVSLRMNVLRNWSTAWVWHTVRSLSILQKLQSSFNVDIAWI
jgi:hypothetical protein